MDTHVIRPLVIVPVLSSATVPHSANASKVTPPRTSTPRRAHAPIAATYTSGAISSAHGAAADRNANALYIAPPRPRNGQPKTKGPTTIVNAVTARIALEYVSPTRSSIIVTAGRRFCAASVRRAMRAGVLSSEDRMDLTTNAPSELTAPAGTLVTHALQNRQRLAGYVLNGDERAAVNDDAVQGNLVRSDDQGEREGGERLFLEGKQIN